VPGITKRKGAETPGNAPASLPAHSRKRKIITSSYQRPSYHPLQHPKSASTISSTNPQVTKSVLRSDGTSLKNTTDVNKSNNGPKSLTTSKLRIEFPAHSPRNMVKSIQRTGILKTPKGNRGRISARLENGYDLFEEWLLGCKVLDESATRITHFLLGTQRVQSNFLFIAIFEFLVGWAALVSILHVPSRVGTASHGNNKNLRRGGENKSMTVLIAL
jgi:hypothetical protein